MRTHHVTGGGGTQLSVVEAGNPQSHPIVFIHGFSQCGLCWSRQLDSDLAESHRLVAVDLRGHGLSDKPRDAYADSKLWADDVHAVLQTLQLEQAILVGWSYGPLVILDYVRHYGDEGIAGMQFVGGISKLGSEEALSVLTPEFLAGVPGLLSVDPDESVAAVESLLDLGYATDLTPQERYMLLGWNLNVPPHVRQALLSRSFDNDDLLGTIRKPVLITHGTSDGVVKVAAAEQFKAAIPHAQLHLMPNLGHAPFWQDAAGFNRRLEQFATEARKGASLQAAL